MKKLTVAWLSAGVSSFIAAYLIRDEIDEFYYIDIDDQHPDSMRFIKDCETALGRPIKILKSNYGSVENAILAQGCIRMVKTGFAPCTAYLKRRVRKEQFEVLHQNDEITYVWGFDSTKHEQTRADRIVEAMPQYNHRFPLIEQGLTKQDAHAVLRRLNIRRPAMYDLGYQNNNCVGCVKGGMGYWNKIRQDFPDVFKARAELERKLNSSCLKECFLDELAPDRGKADNEILEDCGIFCEIAARKITEAADNGGNQNHKMSKLRRAHNVDKNEKRARNALQRSRGELSRELQRNGHRRYGRRTRIARNGVQKPVAVGLATYNRRQRLYIAFRDLPVCKQVSEARQ